MPLIPDPPFPKSQGDTLRSKDWNDACNEIIRLDNAKLNLTGGHITGPLQIDSPVGIGTAAPDRALTIQGGAGTYLNVKGNNGTFQVLLGADNNGGIVSTMTNHDLQLRSGGNATRMVIKADGKLGVGTTTPDQALTLQGVAGTYLNVKANSGAFEVLLGSDSSGGIVSTITNHDLQLRAGGNITRVWVKNDGKVGIGLANPTMTLHVASSANIGPFPVVNDAPGRLMASGGVAEVGFADRVLTSWPAAPAAGDRFLWYNVGRLARFWTEVKGDIISVDAGGNVGIVGHLTVAGGKTGYVVDFFLYPGGQTLEQGDVVTIIEPTETLHYGLNDDIPIVAVDVTDQAYDRRVCGIVAHHVKEGELPWMEGLQTAEQGGKAAHPMRNFAAPSEESANHRLVAGQRLGKMVTLGAFSHCKVDADIAPIQAGDLLTTSPTRGHAQKVLEPEKAAGAIIGKALASIARGKGKIPVIVALQ
jgi:hypothetical protein